MIDAPFVKGWDIEFYPAIPSNPPTDPGTSPCPGSTLGLLTVANHLSEFAENPTAQTEAQTNLGLGVTDPLAYYILAKA